jgi:hypothetical protein
MGIEVNDIVKHDALRTALVQYRYADSEQAIDDALAAIQNALEVIVQERPHEATRYCRNVYAVVLPELNKQRHQQREEVQVLAARLEQASLWQRFVGFFGGAG